MNNLSSFLAKNVLKVENIKYVVSKRFLDEKGKPIQWEIRCIDSTEDEELRRMCTRKVRVEGKKNQYTPEIDFNEYLGKLAAKCTVYPNLNNKDLQNSYGAFGEDVLLKKLLIPGEYADYIAKIQEINGFDITFEDEVKEAKN